ncbi:MAG: hypothetical protein PHV33_05410 [Elusimicrobiales bacterium]|nr:hypothetical protein [Elusimicrobiales bacterium]
MKSKEQLILRIQLMGCQLNFKPYWDTESHSILLEVRKPAQIIDGQLTGSQIDVYDDRTFRAWTPQTTKANRYSRIHSLIIRNLDGECELFVPAAKADEILPHFGAIVKRSCSEATKAILKLFGEKKRSQE